MVSPSHPSPAVIQRTSISGIGGAVREFSRIALVSATGSCSGRPELRRGPIAGVRSKRVFYRISCKGDERFPHQIHVVKFRLEGVLQFHDVTTDPGRLRPLSITRALVLEFLREPWCPLWLAFSQIRPPLSKEMLVNGSACAWPDSTETSSNPATAEKSQGNNLLANGHPCTVRNLTSRSRYRLINNL